MTIRDFSKLEELQPFQWFVVQTKRHEGGTYPPAGWVLPVVYATERFDPETLEHTVKAGAREDFVWINKWHSEGSKLYAFRVAGQLYAMTSPNLYSVRAYDLNGNTLWIRDYWDGTIGLQSGPLGVAIDSEGNSYVCGPCASRFNSTEKWSLISYDKDGQERWRKDLRTMGRALNPSYSSYTGNMRDVCITDDQRIVLLGEPWSRVTAGQFNDFSTWCFFPDGSSAPMPELTYRGTLHSNLLAVGNKVAVIPLAYGNFPGTSSSAACRAGTSDEYFVDTGIATTAAGSNGPNLVRLPAFDTWIHSAAWTYSFNSMWASQTLGNKLSSVCTSDDGSEIYCSALQIHGVLNGKGKTGNIVRLTPTTATASQPAGEGLAPVFPGTDSLLWAVPGVATNHVRSNAVVTSQGVVGTGAGDPGMQLYSKVDGSKIWAHNHLRVVTSMKKQGPLIVTAGVRQSDAQDQTFI